MSENFERWIGLAAQCLSEKDPSKLTELAGEMNRVLNPARQDKTATEGRTLSWEPGVAILSVSVDGKPRSRPREGDRV
jgi:hypothetical protein